MRARSLATFRAVVGLCGLFAGAALAQPTASEADREAELFGEAPDPTPGPTPGPTPPTRAAPAPEPTRTAESDREADLFGAPEGSPEAPPGTAPEPTPPAPPENRTGRTADAGGLRLADPLTVGGRLYLRNDAYFSEDTDLGDQRLDLPNLLDVYLDARPIERVRAYARFRLTYNPAVAASGDLGGGDLGGGGLVGDNSSNNSLFAGQRQTWLVDQLWIKWDWARTAFFTVGVQPVRWGTGRIFNPTDVLNRQRLNALTPFDFRTGMPLARVHLPIEAIGGSLEVLAEFDNASRLGDVGAAARLQGVLGPLEASLSARVRHDRPLLLGADVSTGLGPIDVYGEVALIRGGGARRWNGDYRLPTDAQIAAGDLAALGGLRLPTEEDRDNDWIPQAVLGFEWPIGITDDDTLIVGAEYFYNQNGYDDPTLYPWLITSGDFQPFYLGQHYAAVFAVLANPGPLTETTFVLTALSNLSDRSVIGRLNVTHAVHRHLFLEPYVAVHGGSRGGEFRFAWDLTPRQAGWINDQAERFGGSAEGAGLPEGGIRVRAPVAQAGLWLRVPL